SRDSVKSHDNFCTRQGFRFPLVSDGDEALCKAFDVIHEKNMYGRKVLGVVRSTFMISPASRISQEWRGVKVTGHAEAVLEALKVASKQ
ncbi:MAG: redoxin domain-containing protein, partial [Pseudoxanthomonas sp.]